MAYMASSWTPRPARIQNGPHAQSVIQVHYTPDMLFNVVLPRGPAARADAAHVQADHPPLPDVHRVVPVR